LGTILFTIKKYHDQHPPKNKEEKSIRYPEYRLPTIEEWDRISTHKLVDKRFQYKLKPQPEEIINRIINLYGSVSELTTTPGISKGGSYKDDKTQINSDWNRQYSGPSDWLGFRCVCSWKR